MAALFLPMLFFSAACTNREYTRTPRTGTEQLLIGHALERSMGALQLPVPAPATAAIEVIGLVGQRQLLQPGFLGNGPMINNNAAGGNVPDVREGNLPMPRPASPDLEMMRAVVEGRLAGMGYQPVERREEADLWVRVLVLALGTDQGQTFFGMPAIQSTVIPFSTPALTLYEAQRQIGYVRYRLQTYDRRTRKWHVPGDWYDGLAYYNQYTLFFFINFRGTDLPQAPKLQ
ncbi:MAG TPA: hypothetical protein VFS39_02115 [Nitrospira sp.]|nr:hypothetical protein [Nitrospira sp.]